MWTRSVPHPHGELSPLLALAAVHGGTFNFYSRVAGACWCRPATLREMVEPPGGGKHWPARPAVARIVRGDATRGPCALACFKVLPVPDRKREDDAQPQNAQENFRGPRPWLEPLLCP